MDCALSDCDTVLRRVDVRYLSSGGGASDQQDKFLSGQSGSVREDERNQSCQRHPGRG